MSELAEGRLESLLSGALPLGPPPTVCRRGTATASSPAPTLPLPACTPDSQVRHSARPQLILMFLPSARSPSCAHHVSVLPRPAHRLLPPAAPLDSLRAVTTHHPTSPAFSMPNAAWLPAPPNVPKPDTATARLWLQEARLRRHCLSQRSPQRLRGKLRLDRSRGVGKRQHLKGTGADPPNSGNCFPQFLSLHCQ